MELTLSWFAATPSRLLVLHEEDEDDDDMDAPSDKDDYPETFKELTVWLVRWFRRRTARR